MQKTTVFLRGWELYACLSMEREHAANMRQGTWRWTSFKAFKSFYWSQWALDSWVLPFAGFLSEVEEKSSQTRNQR